MISRGVLRPTGARSRPVEERSTSRNAQAIAGARRTEETLHVDRAIGLRITELLRLILAHRARRLAGCHDHDRDSLAARRSATPGRRSVAAIRRYNARRKGPHYGPTLHHDILRFVPLGGNTDGSFPARSITAHRAFGRCERATLVRAPTALVALAGAQRERRPAERTPKTAVNASRRKRIGARSRNRRARRVREGAISCARTSLRKNFEMFLARDRIAPSVATSPLKGALAPMDASVRSRWLIVGTAKNGRREQYPRIASAPNGLRI